MTKHRAKRISKGHYIYRGFKIIGFYYHPEHRVCWEAVDKDGSGFAHSYSLRETKKWIDYELDKEQENNTTVYASPPMSHITSPGRRPHVV